MSRIAHFGVPGWFWGLDLGGFGDGVRLDLLTDRSTEKLTTQSTKNTEGFTEGFCGGF